MTMQEIDKLRKAADDATETLRRVEQQADTCPECRSGAFASWSQAVIEEARLLKQQCEDDVITALSIYWRERGM
jgi:hypothetical protein